MLEDARKIVATAPPMVIPVHVVPEGERERMARLMLAIRNGEYDRLIERFNARVDRVNELRDAYERDHGRPFVSPNQRSGW